MKLKRWFTIFSMALLFATNVNAQDKPVINHIAVYVQSLDTCTRFYRDVIGLEVIPEPFHDGRHTWFAIGDHAALHLIQGAKEITMHDKNSHLCFSVTSIERFINQLEENKIAYESWAGDANTFTTRADGIKQIYFTDPEGYWIEVNNDR